MLTLRQQFKLSLLKVRVVAFLEWGEQSEWFLPTVGMLLGVTGMIIALAV